MLNNGTIATSTKGQFDRTLRTVFTHDHFGPSTHQQVGFYQGLVIEPKGSRWRNPEKYPEEYYSEGRADGGPTSWRADILFPHDSSRDYREFLLEFSDFQLAYKKGGGGTAEFPVPDPDNVINPPVKNEPGLPVLVEHAKQCPGTTAAPPCPEAVSAADPGTQVVNYRNEPIPHRIAVNPDSNKTQALGWQGDLSHVFRSIERAWTPMNAPPDQWPVRPLSKDTRQFDPATPILRADEDDKVQVRVLVGGFEEGHNFGVQGMRWLFEPSDPNSGFRNNQMMGISEHYEFEVPQFPRGTEGQHTDYRYAPGSAVDDLWNGLWGMLRAYSAKRGDADGGLLLELPNNPKHLAKYDNKPDFKGICPIQAPTKPFEVAAYLAKDVLREGTLVYNHRGDYLHDPSAIVYVQTKDIAADGKLAADINPEPLILRANAGDCIEVTLHNRLPSGTPPDPDGWNTLPMIVEHFNANEINPSNEVGLTPQLVFHDVSDKAGLNVGFNKPRTVLPGHSFTYQWYAGAITIDKSNQADSTTRDKWVATPIEFGAINLMSSDPIKHSNKGAVGALVVEPQGATWPEYGSMSDPKAPGQTLKTRSQLTVTLADGVKTFRDFVLIFQNDLNLQYSGGKPVPNTAEAEDSEDSGQKAFNYRTEPLWKRMGFAPETHLSCGWRATDGTVFGAKDDFGNPVTECTNKYDFTDVLSNGKVGGDPVTPVFTARAGENVRFRILHPGGHARNNVIQVHGHNWQEEPYTSGSAVLGNNPLSNWQGSQYGVGPGSHFDLLFDSAGGTNRVTGDYLYRDQGSFPFSGGLWGIFRVTP